MLGESKAIREVAAKPPIILIRPSRGWTDLRLGDLWEYRELLYFLVWRDLKARYKQTLLGAGWAILQPLLATLIFSLVFGYLVKVPTQGIPYPIFAYAALLPWNYFADALRRSSTSVVNSAHLISKVYFPRLILPLSGVIWSLVDFGLAFIVLIGMMVYYQVAPTPALLLLPALVLLAMATALGVSLWLAALNVQYRDVTYLIPFLTQVWMYATPVVYSSTLIPERWRALYGLNPMAGVVESFRWALLGQGQPPGPLLWVSVGVVFLLLIGGLFFFRRMERTFADVI